MKVMVIDDSATSITLLTAYLEKMQHQVVSSTHPKDAVDLFTREKPDLVILDVMMEELSGYECAKQLRLLQADDDDWVPIIFVSALVDDVSLAKGIDAGGDEYLTKPFTEINLRAKIKSMQRISAMRNRLLLLTAKLERANNHLSQLSRTDALTGIANRRAFEIRYAREWKRCIRSKLGDNHLGLIMIDIDLFKKYNDQYGHQAGDVCLHSVANTLERLLQRETDEVFRYGGEEFVVIIPLANKESVKLVAESLLIGVRQMKLELGEATISLGVGSCEVTREADRADFLHRVDQALYAAKAAGRNCLVCI